MGMSNSKRHLYSLKDMVAQCDLKAAEPVDMAAWHNLQPVGRDGWAEASKNIAAGKDDVLVWPEFKNEDDKKSVW